MTKVKHERGVLSRSRKTRAVVAVSLGMGLAAGLGSSATAASDPGQNVSSTQGKPARQAMNTMYPDAKVKTSGDVRIVDQGRTATGAWVEFTGTGTVEVDGSAKATQTPTIGPYALVDTWVSGGRWFYGTSVNSGGQKACHSKYHHKWRWHSATAKMDGYVSKKVMEKNRWANAAVIRWTNETCRVYYNRYDD